MSDPQTTANRIHRRRTRGWRMPDNAICVDRSTPFGNPFPIARGTSSSVGRTKDIWCIGTWEGPGLWFKDTKEEATALSVQAFRAWINSPQQSALRDKARIMLRGKHLACWCPLDQPCHADVLLEIANGE